MSTYCVLGVDVAAVTILNIVWSTEPYVLAKLLLGVTAIRLKKNEPEITMAHKLKVTRKDAALRSFLNRPIFTKA